jgi:hypothetical protein
MNPQNHVSTKQRLRDALNAARSLSSMTEEPPPTNGKEWDEKWMKIEPMMNNILRKMGETRSVHFESIREQVAEWSIESKTNEGVVSV